MAKSKQSGVTPPKLRRPTFRPDFEFKVRCGGGLHTIKLVGGAMVLVDHIDKDKHEAMAVQAVLSGTSLKCLSILKEWRGYCYIAAHPALRDIGSRRHWWKRQAHQLCKTPNGSSNSPKRLECRDWNNDQIREYYNDLDGRQTPTDKLKARRKQHIDGVFRMALYKKADYYKKDLNVDFTFGRELRFLKARSGYAPTAAIQLPYDYRKKMAGMSIIDGHFIVDVIEKTDVGHRVLALRLVARESYPSPAGMYSGKAANIMWRKALSAKPKDLDDYTVVPVIAEAMAYPKRGGKSQTLVWSLWKTPITAEEVRL